MDQMKKNRQFMRCPDFAEGMKETDQQLKKPQPPLEKPAQGEVLELPFCDTVKHKYYTDILDTRRSVRKYSDEPATQEQLAFLLWSVQGVQSVRGAGYATFRPVPSGGARHPFETYITVRDVTGLKPGLYHYLPLDHVGEKRVSVAYVKPLEEYEDTVSGMLAGQSFAATAPLVLFFTCLPYRGEWRYAEMAHRVMLIDLGHVGQNAMLSAAAMGMGSCCFAAFHSARCDEILGVDGDTEYTVYAVSAGFAKNEG